MSDKSIRRSSKPTDAQKKQPIGRVSKFNGIFLGIIKENKDAHRNGRLKVWIPEFASRPEDEKGVFTMSWSSPFAGSTPFIDNTPDPEIEKMEGSQTSYGMWMQPPDINNQVLVTFLNGDPQWGVVLGCLFQQYMNHMVPGNATVPPDKHHDADTDPCPLPVSEYNKKMEDEYSEDTVVRPVHHWQALGLRNAGLLRDDIRGTTTASARREAPSQVYGISTPGPIDYRSSSKKRKGYDNERESGQNTARMGGHQLIMDDHPDQEHIRLRTRSGAQLLIDETNGLIYACNRDGTGWIQIDEKGRLDAWGADSASLRYEKDINLRADRDINIEAGRNISVKANRDYEKNEEDTQHAGELQGEGGRITLHGNEDIHMIAHEELQAVTRTGSMHFTSAKDFNATVNNTTSWGTGDDYCVVIGNEMSVQVEHDVDFIVNNGNYKLSIDGNYYHHASNDNSIFAGNDNRLQAVNDTEIFAYSGKMDVGSQLNMTVKSYEADVNVEAKEKNIKLQSNEGANQISMREGGIATFSESGTVNYSKANVDFVVNPDLGVSSNPGEITYQGNPISGCLFNPELLSIRFDDRSADFSVPEDVKYKIDTSFLDTSVNNINESLEQIETRFNHAMQTLYTTLADEINGLDSFPLTFDIPTLSIPQIGVDFSLPGLNLPDFNFNMCVDFSNMVNVDTFNPFPDGSFVTINADLGGWTISNLKRWGDAQKANFDLMVDSFDIAKQLTNVLDTTIDQVISNAQFIKLQMDNLVDVNITDKGAAFANYRLGISDMKLTVSEYNTTAQSVGGIPRLLDLENELVDHERSLEQMEESIAADGNYDSVDFTELANTADQWQDYIDSIIGFES